MKRTRGQKIMRLIAILAVVFYSQTAFADTVQSNLGGIYNESSFNTASNGDFGWVLNPVGNYSMGAVTVSMCKQNNSGNGTINMVLSISGDASSTSPYWNVGQVYATSTGVDVSTLNYCGTNPSARNWATTTFNFINQPTFTILPQIVPHFSYVSGGSGTSFFMRVTSVPSVAPFEDILRIAPTEGGVFANWTDCRLRNINGCGGAPLGTFQMVFSIDGNPSFAYYATSTSNVPPQCGITDLAGCISIAISWAFVPSHSTLTQFQSLSLANVIPFSYIYSFQSLFASSTATSTDNFPTLTLNFGTYGGTTTINFYTTIQSAIGDTDINFAKDIIKYGLWLLFFFYIYERVHTIWS